MNEELQRRDDPTVPAEGHASDNGLQPGAGKPLVEGPPMSVSEPVQDETINRYALTGGIVLAVIGVVVALAIVVGLVIFVLSR